MAWDVKLAWKRLEPHLSAILEVARARGEAPALLAALGSRETEWGYAPGYSPKTSPDGTGDWVARRGSWLSKPGVRSYPDGATLPSGWSKPRDKDGHVLPGPYALPGDLLGWGRGFFQCDAFGEFAHRYHPGWTVIEQLHAACDELAADRVGLASIKAHPLFEQAVVCAYNADRARVLAAVKAGQDPDRVTTPGPRELNGSKAGDYGSDVLDRASAFRASYAYQLSPVHRFPPGPPAKTPEKPK